MYTVEYDRHLKDMVSKWIVEHNMPIRWFREIEEEVGITFYKGASGPLMASFPSESDYIMFAMKYS